MKTRTDIQPAVSIESLILTVRGEKVILDTDLARIFGAPTFRFNEAIKRNRERFPADFMFQLTQDDFASLTSQFAMSKPGRGGRRTLPYAFTENGAIMAANVLNSPQAVRMSVFVVRAFVRMRELLGGTKELARRLKDLEAKLTARLDGHEAAIVDVLQRIMRLLDPPPEPETPRRQIGFHARPGEETAGTAKGRKRCITPRLRTRSPLPRISPQTSSPVPPAPSAA
ncbi:MAG: ORF6N domain-containing protein [Verrucomicrobia bacterium]|nr:ORF6N domain-containing protein [Verrucomicrobiota bacterium]